MSPSRPLRVLVSGFFGHRNLGDELILRSLIDRAAAERPDIRFVIATNQPQRVQEDFGLEAVPLGDIEAVSKVIETADAAILGGGGLWHDYSFKRAGGIAALFNGSTASIGGYARPVMMAAAAGIPFHIYGLGVGPLTDPKAFALARFVAAHAESIAVRDVASANILEQIEDWTKPVSVVPDMVYAIDLERTVALPEIRNAAGELPVLMVNIRPWPYGEIEPLLDRLAQAIDKALSQRPHLMVGLPMQQQHDDRAIASLFERIDPRHPRMIVDWGGDTERAVSAVRAADAVVAMRLHTNLLAHCLGVPAVGISYDPKVRAHFEEIGRDSHCVDFDVSSDELTRQFDQILGQGGAISNEVRQTIGALRQRSKEGISELLASVPGS